MKHIDSVGFQLGVDMFRYGQYVQTHMPSVVREGYKYAKTSKHKRIMICRSAKKWLQVRRSAFLRGIYFDPRITVEYLDSIYDIHCPVTRMKMTTATGNDTDASIDRICNNYGYQIGNIVFMSVKANRIKGQLMPDEIRAIAASGSKYNGLYSSELKRIAYMVDVVEEGQKDNPRQYLAGEHFVRGLPYGCLASIQARIVQILQGFDDDPTDALDDMDQLIYTLRSASSRKSPGINLVGLAERVFRFNTNGRSNADSFDYWKDRRNRRRLLDWWGSLTKLERDSLDHKMDRSGVYSEAVYGPTRSEYDILSQMDESSPAVILLSSYHDNVSMRY